MRWTSLRARSTIAFTAFGVLFGALFVLAIWFTGERVEAAFLETIIADELERFVETEGEGWDAAPLSTRHLESFLAPLDALDTLPHEIRRYDSGLHEVLIDGREHDLAVADAGGFRYALLYDEDQIDAIEVVLVRFLFLVFLGTVLGSALLGWLVSGRITAPVRRLAAQVSQAGRKPGVSLVGRRDDDEVARLARSFEEAFRHTQAVLEREREFTADVSHQLRSPIAVIMSTVELLQTDDSITGPHRERLDRLGLATHQLARQIEALLFLAREPSGADGTIDVADAARRVVAAESVLLSADPSSITLQVDAQPFVQAPSEAFEIVLGNLLQNAVAHGDGRATVRIERRAVAVHNRGIPIPPDWLDRVFERGVRGPTHSTGSGLGLSIARRLCERSGWRLTLDSDDENGTTARVEFEAREQTTRGRVAATSGRTRG